MTSSFLSSSLVNRDPIWFNLDRVKSSSRPNPSHLSAGSVSSAALMLEGVRLGSESKQTVNYDWRVKQASAVLHMYVSYNDDDDDVTVEYI